MEAVACLEWPIRLPEIVPPFPRYFVRPPVVEDVVSELLRSSQGCEPLHNAEIGIGGVGKSLIVSAITRDRRIRRLHRRLPLAQRRARRLQRTAASKSTPYAVKVISGVCPFVAFSAGSSAPVRWGWLSKREGRTGVIHNVAEETLPPLPFLEYWLQKLQSAGLEPHILSNSYEWLSFPIRMNSYLFLFSGAATFSYSHEWISFSILMNSYILLYLWIVIFPYSNERFHFLFSWIVIFTNYYEWLYFPILMNAYLFLFSLMVIFSYSHELLSFPIRMNGYRFLSAWIVIFSYPQKRFYFPFLINGYVLLFLWMVISSNYCK